MNQLERLKVLICQLIGDNNFLVSSLKCIKQRGDQSPAIDLSFIRGSDFLPSINTIKLGTPDILGCYYLAKLCNQSIVPMTKVNLQYMNYHFCCQKCEGVIVNIPNTEYEEINKRLIISKFLNDTDMTMYDALTVYSLAYSLYHEIGHALHNKYISESEPIKRELTADAYAFEAVKSLCDIENRDILLLGSFIGITHVLCRRKPQDETDDKEHPHSIERLYNLFSVWGIQDDSQYWELAFLFVSRWCRWNHEPMDWLKDSSKKSIEKFMDAYYHYRKLQI